MTDQVRVAGVGMIPFSKPGRSKSYPVMAEGAARAALDDAGIPYTAVQQAYAGYVYGDSAAGQSEGTHTGWIRLTRPAPRR
ncbi:hypothetical protein ACIBVL_24945 [Streptomyces sp. NPDC049687]|uniref:hypothetical protein n=1 Tax=Streptomyces sp. NPDC049687 TaxID=3365596 RepID=UPI003789C813